MNGKRYILDTNAIIAVLQGNKQLLQCLHKAEWIGISILSQLEFLCFSALTNQDKYYFAQFLKRIDVIGLESNQISLLEDVIRMRQQYRLKLPDAVIAGTAIHTQAILVTADKHFQKIGELNILNVV